MVMPSGFGKAKQEVPFEVRLVLDRSHLRQWHLCLHDRLNGMAGVRCGVRLADGDNGLPTMAGRMFDAERLMRGTPRLNLARPALPSAFAKLEAAGDADLVLDLSGVKTRDGAAAPQRTWTLTFDGHPGEAALLAALLHNRLPVAEVRSGDMVLATGALGTEYQGIAGAAFEDCLWRGITLIAKAVDEARSGSTGMPSPPAASAAPRPTLPNTSGAAVLSAKTAVRSAISRAYRLGFYSPQWRVGWRIVGPDGDLFDRQRHPAQGWTDLPDDGRRFYADPFPIEHNGKMFLFVEDFVHSVGKGIIAAVEFGANGPIGRLEPVLETPFHLSYPFVFAHAGEMWMIPESSSAGCIELFRATDFPSGWVRHATLVSGVAASDATLVERDGRWWMAATVRDGGGSFSDALYLWSADDPLGPWRPHKRNPVLIDISSARPAGRFVERDGELWRPVQDCRERYGGALALARVLKLDDDGFEQRVEVVLRAGGPEWPGRRMHTVNRCGRFEFIDGSGTPPRQF